MQAPFPFQAYILEGFTDFLRPTKEGQREERDVITFGEVDEQDLSIRSLKIKKRKGVSSG